MKKFNRQRTLTVQLLYIVNTGKSKGRKYCVKTAGLVDDGQGTEGEHLSDVSWYVHDGVIDPEKIRAHYYYKVATQIIFQIQKCQKTSRFQNWYLLSFF